MLAAITIFCTVLIMYRPVKKIRASFFIKQANSYLAVQDTNTAIEKIRLALALDESNIYALRLIAQICQVDNPSYACKMYEKILLLHEYTFQDVQALIMICAKLQDFSAVNELLLKYTVKNSITPAFYKELILAVEELQNFDLETMIVRSGIKIHPEDLFLKFKYAVMLLKTQPASQSNVIQTLLWDVIIQSDVELRNEAAYIFYHNFIPTKKQRNFLESHIHVNYPITELKESILNECTLDMKLHPGKCDKILKNIIELLPKAPVDQQIYTYRWLRKRNQLKLIVDTLEQDKILSNRDLLMVYLDALAGLNQWKIVRSLIIKERILDVFTKGLFKVRVALELGELDAANVQFRDLMQKIKNNPKALIQIGEYFSKLHMDVYTIEAYVTALEVDPYNLLATNKLIQLVNTVRDVSPLQIPLSKLIKKTSQKVEFVNASIYVDLLMDQSVQQAYITALKLNSIKPNDIDCQTTLALACLKTARNFEALEIYKSFKNNSEHKTPRWNAIFALVLAANNQPDAARLLMLMAEAGTLNIQEVMLIKPFW